MAGADGAGYAGYKDKVNTHFWKVFSSAFLMSGIVAGVNLSQDQSGGENGNDRQRASDAMSEALGQQLGQAMTQMIMKNMNVSPTIEIRAGYRFNIVVSKDLTFTKPYESFDY
jgi:type IV secretion system protein VirB10